MARPKNLLFASAQIGTGDVETPVTDHSAIVARRAGAYRTIGQFLRVRFAARQEIERLVRPRQQRVEEPCVRSIGPPCGE